MRTRSALSVLGRTGLGGAISLWLAASALAVGPYLTNNEPDALALLAPPPISGSAEAAADLAEVWSVFKTRTPSDEAAAKAEEELTVWVFTPAIGPGFFPGHFPKTEALLAEVAQETGRVTAVPKKHYQRPRPFMIDKSLLVGPPESGYSYPSGHSTTGTVYAMLLAELFPDKSDAILAEARTVGWHRVQLARHYPTDIYAGRVLARAIVRELEKNPQFQTDFAECKAEVAGKP